MTDKTTLARDIAARIPRFIEIRERGQRVGDAMRKLLARNGMSEQPRCLRQSYSDLCGRGDYQ
jgi:hypothetical protein